jgi:hypothetical protein
MLANLFITHTHLALSSVCLTLSILVFLVSSSCHILLSAFTHCQLCIFECEAVVKFRILDQSWLEVQAGWVVIKRIRCAVVSKLVPGLTKQFWLGLSLLLPIFLGADGWHSGNLKRLVEHFWQMIVHPSELNDTIAVQNVGAVDYCNSCCHDSVLLLWGHICQKFAWDNQVSLFTWDIVSGFCCCRPYYVYQQGMVLLSLDQLI